jgi:hypothetical protein
VEVGEGSLQVGLGEVGEDAEGDGQGDRVGDAGEGETGVFDEVVFGEARGVGEFVEPTVPHQGERGVGAPVVAGFEVGHGLVTEAEGAAADVEELVVRGHADAKEGPHLDAGGLVPAAADDVAVAACRDGVGIEARGEVGGGEFRSRGTGQAFGSFFAAAAAFIRARSCSFVSRGGVTDFGAPFWLWSGPRRVWRAPLGLPDFE